MISYERAHELFRYDPKTGDLFWRASGSGRTRPSVKVTNTGSHGYIQVQADGDKMLAHRVIFLMHYGFVPSEVDHRNHERQDNRAANLRAATKGQNNANVPMRKRTTTGLKGVRPSGPKWVARISVSGKTRYLGTYSTAEDAADAYDAEAKTRFGEFACTNQQLKETET